jgi:Flp pilus assembly protein TadD
LYDQAVETLARAVDRPKAYNDIGYIALANGHNQIAQNLLEEAIRLSPVHYETAQRNLALARGGRRD